MNERTAILTSGISLTFAAILLLWGCRKEPTTWSVDLHLPVVDVLLDWWDVLPADATLEVSPGEAAHLIWSGEVARLDVAGLASIPDTTVTNDLTPDFVGGPFFVPPGSILLDEAEDISFAVDGPEFRSLTLDSGLLAWTVESTTDGYVQLQYDFPGVVKNGVPVSLDITLPPATESGGLAAASGFIDIADATVDFTGVSGFERNKIASNLTIGTPTDITDTALVYGDDSIRVAMTFMGMQVRDIEGYFGNFEIDIDEGVPLLDPDVFPSGLVAMSPERADLKLVNGMAADLRLNLNGLSLGGSAMSHPAFGVDQYIARADWSAGAPPVTDALSIDLLATEPGFFALLATLPDNLQASGVLEINPLGDVSGGNDYFHKDYAPSLNLDLDLPLRVALTDLAFRDTIRIVPTDVPDFTGQIALELRNGFPVQMDITGSWQPAGTPFAATLPARSGLDAPVTHVALPVTSAELAAGGDLVFEARVATSGYTSFTGAERIRIRGRVEGTHNVVIE
jgi:hypothetical protein